ncbi:MAG: polyprenol monophosphomannose synthase [Nitrososphaerales archaeon]
MKVCVVIPSYNEKESITQLVNGIRNYFDGSEHIVNILIVDDNSPDGTAELVRSLSINDPSIHLISRPRKMGLGSAYTDAFEWILDNLAVDAVIQMDADLSHPPQLLPQMIQVLQGGADAVVASRYSGQGGIDSWPLHRRIISKGANFYARTLLGVRIKDVTSGYRAFKINVIEQLLANRLSSKGYEYQVESIYIISNMNKNIEEVPFTFKNRREGKSKLTLKDIVRFAGIVLALRFRSPVNADQRMLINNEPKRR